MWPPHCLTRVACFHCPCDAERALDRDFFLSSEEAVAWGLVDEITTRRAAQDTATAAHRGMS